MKSIRFFSKGERNTISGENVHRDTDIMSIFVKQAQEKNQSRKHYKMVLELKLPKGCGFQGIWSPLNEEYKLYTKFEFN